MSVRVADADIQESGTVAESVPVAESGAAKTVPVAESMLSETQVRALTVIVRGGSLMEAAAAAGVDRTTLYRWRKEDAQFIAALNAWRHEQQLHAKDRLLGLATAATDAVAGTLAGGDGRLGLRVLKELACTGTGPTQPTDPARVFGKDPNAPKSEVEQWYELLFRTIKELPHHLRDRAPEMIRIGHRYLNPTGLLTWPPCEEHGHTPERIAAHREAEERARSQPGFPFDV